MFSRNVRNVCPIRHLPTLTKLRTLPTLPTLREGGNQEYVWGADVLSCRSVCNSDIWYLEHYTHCSF